MIVRIAASYADSNGTGSIVHFNGLAAGENVGEISQMIVNRFGINRLLEFSIGFVDGGETNLIEVEDLETQYMFGFDEDDSDNKLLN